MRSPPAQATDGQAARDGVFCVPRTPDKTSVLHQADLILINYTVNCNRIVSVLSTVQKKAARTPKRSPVAFQKQTLINE